MLSINVIRTSDELKASTGPADFAEGMHRMLVPFEDSLKDIRRGIDYALDQNGCRGGFILAALEDGSLKGGLVMLRTNMSGFVPENLLLYVAVDGESRGRGIGTKLIEKALGICEGAVKLHVEYDNPARKLYERIGFVSKYADMRYGNE